MGILMAELQTGEEDSQKGGGHRRSQGDSLKGFGREGLKNQGTKKLLDMCFH